MGIDLVILVISRWGERVGRGNSVILCSHGRLAQRLAQVLYTHKAGGSNPSSPTKECEREGRVALAFLFSVRGFGLRSGRGAGGFEPHLGRGVGGFEPRSGRGAEET